MITVKSRAAFVSDFEYIADLDHRRPQLWRYDHVRPNVVISLSKGQANADQLGNCRAVPLREPARRHARRGASPIGEVEASDAAQQLCLGRDWPSACELVAMRRPCHDETAAPQVEREVGAPLSTQPGRQVADKGQM